jgi:phage-related protein
MAVVAGGVSELRVQDDDGIYRVFTILPPP